MPPETSVCILETNPSQYYPKPQRNDAACDPKIVLIVLEMRVLFINVVGFPTFILLKILDRFLKCLTCSFETQLVPVHFLHSDGGGIISNYFELSGVTQMMLQSGCHPTV